MQNRLKKHLLALSILCSLLFHLGTLLLLQRHSLWFKTTQLADAPSLTALTKTHMLRDAFQTLSQQEQIKVHTIEREERLCSPIPILEQRLESNDLLVFQPEPPFPLGELLVSNGGLPLVFKSLTFPLELFPKDLVLPTFSAPLVAPSYPPLHPERMVLEVAAPLGPQPPAVQPFDYGEPRLDVPQLADTSAKERAALSLPTPALPLFPTLDELETSSYSDSFDVEVTFEEQSDGYIFALTLIPRQDLHLPKIHQHYSFLIDRSNSIQRERLIATKNAVLRALDKLAPDDTFNIIVFDSKVEKLFPTAKAPNIASLSAARAFLDEINLGSFFSTADLYNPLFLILPQRVEDDATHIAILLTDGENFTKKNALYGILQNWTGQNSGKVALYTIGMNTDAQLAALDVASAFNKGRLFYAPTNRGIKRKLLKLMGIVHTPLAKNINCQAISKGPSQQISLYPRSSEMPHLYLGQPFTILGKCDTMDDFILFAQGRLKDRWMNVKKHISFLNAKKGGNHLKQEWALAQAYRCYERYLFDDNPSHLAEAKELLQPFDIQPAFQ